MQTKLSHNPFETLLNTYVSEEDSPQEDTASCSWGTSASAYEERSSKKKQVFSSLSEQEEALFLEEIAALKNKPHLFTSPEEKSAHVFRSKLKGSKKKQKVQQSISTVTAYVEAPTRLADESAFAKLRNVTVGKKEQHTASTKASSLKKTKQKSTAPVEDSMTMQDLLDGQRTADAQDHASMEAFFTAMKGVDPLTAKGRDIAPQVQPSVSAEQVQDAFALMMESQLEFALALKGEYIEGHVVGLDALTMNNLRAGVYSPEAHLDLHGLNAMQAYQALVNFFKLSWYKGLRTVLLIPGRGKNSPNGVSVLREKMQLWLTQDPFKRVVLAFCTAQPLDGGPGTLYVLLRKYKKKGKICWERLPSDPDLY